MLLIAKGKEPPKQFKHQGPQNVGPPLGIIVDGPAIADLSTASPLVADPTITGSSGHFLATGTKVVAEQL